MVYKNQAIGIGVVTRAYPHKEKSDTGHYQCDVRLVDSEQFLANVPVATQRAGLACTPQEKDLVLVAFVGGDLYSPVIIGTLYSNKVQPPMYQEGEIIYVCPPARKSQPPSKELKRFHLELPGGMKLTVREEDVHYEYEKYVFDLKKEDGLKLQVNDKTKLTVNKQGDVAIAAGNTKISIKQDGDIVIDSMSKVGVKTTGNVELASSGGDLKLSANNITLEGKTGVSVKGLKLDLSADTTVEIKANATLDLKSSGITNVKGSMVNIN